jgi:hypothetical protein
MEIKFLTMSCPDCDKEMRSGTLCVNTPTNEFDIGEIEQSEFHCVDCDKTFFIGDIDYFTE